MRRASIPIASIRRDGHTQPRDGLDENLLSQFAHDMRAGDTFWPVRLFEDDDGNLWLSDGFHRVQAAINIGRDTIEADIEHGDAKDAYEYAVRQAESIHQLTMEEKRRAARRFLSDSERWPKSSRWIGRACGLDHKTVEAIRGELSGEIPQMRARERCDMGSSSSQAPKTPSCGDDRSSEQSTDHGARRPRRIGPVTERLLTVNGETHNLVEWSRITGVPHPTIRHRLNAGESPEMAVRPHANERRQCNRGGRVYVMSARKKKRPSKVGNKASSMLRGTAVLADPEQRKKLASLPRDMQRMVARRIKDGESSTVQQATDAILGGAPVDAWGRAYAALMDLGVDDRERICTQVLSEISAGRRGAA